MPKHDPMSTEHADLRIEMPVTFVTDDGVIVVNFGILTGREATQAEKIDRLAQALNTEAGAGPDITIVSSRRHTRNRSASELSVALSTAPSAICWWRPSAHWRWRSPWLCRTNWRAVPRKWTGCDASRWIVRVTKRSLLSDATSASIPTTAWSPILWKRSGTTSCARSPQPRRTTNATTSGEGSALSVDQRQQVMALVTDFPRLWRDPRLPSASASAWSVCSWKT